MKPCQCGTRGLIRCARFDRSRCARKRTVRLTWFAYELADVIAASVVVAVVVVLVWLHS